MVKDNEEGTELQQDEYHYSDPDSATETYVEEHAEEPPVAHSPMMAGMGDDRVKRIVAILVIVAVVFVLVHFLKPKNITPKPDSVASVEQNVAIPAGATQVQTTVAVTPAPMPSSMDVAVSPSSDDMKKLTEQSQKNAADIQQLATSMENLQANVLQLAEFVKSLKAEPKKKAYAHSAHENVGRMHKRKSIKLGTSEVYYLKAVVPRRAWLQTTQGDTLTVQVGDRLKGYGTVEFIDPSEGTVTTSSHKIIHFSANDN